MRIRRRHLVGLTLVEMLLYVGICSVFLVSLSTFFSSLLSVKVKSRTVNEVNQQGLQLTNFLSYTIRNARTIAVPAVLTSSSTLILGMKYPTTSTTTLRLLNGTLYIQEGTSTQIALSNNRVTISSLLFNNTTASSTDGGSVTISFVIDHNNPANKNEFSFSKQFDAIVDFH